MAGRVVDSTCSWTEESFTFIMFNNCRASPAMRNALDMLKILQG